MNEEINKLVDILDNFNGMFGCLLSKPESNLLVSYIKGLEHNLNELKKWLEEEIYKIEPKGTAINYNCEYDSEEDFISAMEERSKLITLKRVLIMLQSLEKGGNNE